MDKEKKIVNVTIRLKLSEKEYLLAKAEENFRTLSQECQMRIVRSMEADKQRTQ